MKNEVTTYSQEKPRQTRIMELPRGAIFRLGFDVWMRTDEAQYPAVRLSDGYLRTARGDVDEVLDEVHLKTVKE